jgi:hypothetical protein
MKHRDVQKAIVKRLQTRFGPAFRYWNNLGGIGVRKGTLDLHCLVHGTFIGIEVKTPGYPTVTPEQQAEIKAIQAAGGKAGVVMTLADLETLIEGIKSIQKGSQ